MFGKTASAKKALDGVDFTPSSLRERLAYSHGHLANLGLGGEVTAHAYDPVQGLLAVGTATGELIVLGRPGVHVAWDLGRPLKIKHLAFRSGSGMLVVVDSKDTLSVYDLAKLDSKGKPTRDSSLSMRSVVTCIEVPVAHCFAFFGGKDGTVDVYDLDRGVLAPNARIPNLWLAQEEILRRSGVADAPSRRHIPVCTDIKAHPTDLNLLLIAYEGGVSLWNIAQRRAERNWEFVVGPGAPGGGNDPDDIIFNERRPAITSLAWRPDGLVFAVGHEDGAISFACVSDENPIAMRTIERADVNKATEADLFGFSGTQAGEVGQRRPANREPIFRLAWSAFPEETLAEKAAMATGWGAPGSPSAGSSTFSQDERINLKGGTILTILGGLLPKDPTGIHLLELPPYVASSVAATTTTGNISSAFRQALKDSLQPVQHTFYPTPAPPEDFLLLPRSSPHYGGAHDPFAIVITVGDDPSLPALAAPHSRRGLEAWSFPPSPSSAPGRPPRQFLLPPPLVWSGGGTCTSAKMVNVSPLAYQRLLHQLGSPSPDVPDFLPLKGGLSTPLSRPARPGPMSDGGSSKEARILVSSHLDLSIRFWDVSDAVIEEGNEPFPRGLPHLTIDSRSILRDAVVQAEGGLEAARILRERPWELELAGVDLAAETLELAVALSTGEVIVLKLVYGQRDFSGAQAAVELDLANEDAQDAIDGALSDLRLDRVNEPAPMQYSSEPSRCANLDGPSRRPSLGPSPIRRFSLSRDKASGNTRGAATSEPPREAQDHYLDLTLVANSRPAIDSFRPVAAFKLPVSQIGTGGRMCVAQSDIGFLAASSEAGLIVVDMRGPEVLLIDTAGSSVGQSKGKHRGGGGDASPITSLTWTISAVGADHDRSPRLIVVQQSGQVGVYELSQVAGSWLLSTEVVTMHHDHVAGAFVTFVLDRQGALATAGPMQLQRALAHQSNIEHGVSSDLDGKKSFTSVWITISPKCVAAYFNIDGPRTALLESDGFFHAQVVLRQGWPVLVVASRHQSSLIVLSLPDLVQVNRLTFGTEVHSASGEISMSTDGDFVQHVDPFTIKLHTIFDGARPAYPPAVVLHRPEIWVPTSSALTAVKSTFTSLFGGQKVYTATEIETLLGGPDRPAPKQRAGVQTAISRPPRAPQRARTEVVQGDATATTSILARTQEALQERGESLGYLQERLGTMANDAAKFASDAAKQAKQEAARATLKNSMMGYLGRLG